MVMKKVQTKTNCWFDVNIQAIAMTIQNDMNPMFGIPNHPTLICYFTKGALSWFVDEDDWTKLEYKTLEIVLKNPGIAKDLRKKFFRRTKIFEKFTRNLEKTNLTKLSKKELLKLYKDYSYEYRKLIILGEPLALYVKDKLTEHLEKELKEKSRNVTRDVNFLVSNDYINFTKREEIDILKLALKANKNNINKLIKEHTKKYFWIPFDYGVTTWDEKHFMKEYNKIKDAKKELDNIKTYYKNLRKNQRALEKKLKLTRYQRSLFEAQREFAIIMDYKKEVFTKGHYKVEPLSREIAKRLGLTFNQMRCLENNELFLCLEGKMKPDKKVLDERMKFSIVKLTLGGEYVYFIGKKARDFYEKNLVPKVKDSKVIKGRSASKGKYRGKARVILNAKNIGKIKEGEVLVTYMTSPDYTIGMKKAGAFVTDEGGMTCHAAIVARELGKPCVIGTKHGTRIIKDGDMVEVDADKGVVRRL
ncbi:MAG: PEP-utilizing enzyme [archaeon]